MVQAISNANKMNTPVLTEDEGATVYTGTIKITTLGRLMRDENLKSTVGWSFVEAGIGVQYFEWLKFNFALTGIFGEGAGQNYLNGDGAAANLIILDTAAIELKPINEITLTAGVIAYRINPLSSVMSAGTSPGLEQKVELQNKMETFKFSLIGNEAIPSFGVNKTVVDQDKTPFFLSGTAMVEGKFSPINSTIKLAATQFKFGNLPANVSGSTAGSGGAVYAGNSLSSVSGVGENMQFIIGFAGTESAAVFETEWTSNLKTILKAATIKNDQAFQNENQGKVGKVEVEWTRKNIKLTPNLMVFEVESDVTPAAFSIFANRLNNRKGFKTGLSLELIKQKIAFSGSYMKSIEIENTPFLFDREVYNLGLEVNYDLFK